MSYKFYKKVDNTNAIISKILDNKENGLLELVKSEKYHKNIMGIVNLILNRAKREVF